MDEILQTLGGVHRSVFAGLEFLAQPACRVRQLAEPRMDFVF